MASKSKLFIGNSRQTRRACFFPAVRAALAAGDFEHAQEFWDVRQISGHVIHGQKLGRTIGFRP